MSGVPYRLRLRLLCVLVTAAAKVVPARPAMAYDLEPCSRSVIGKLDELRHRLCPLIMKRFNCH